MWSRHPDLNQDLAVSEPRSRRLSHVRAGRRVAVRARLGYVRRRWRAAPRRGRRVTTRDNRGDRIAVDLAYGSTGLPIELPADATTVIRPRPRASAKDPLSALRTAIGEPVAGPPLREIARRGQRVAISVCDITRPQPRPLMLRAIMEALDGIIRPEDVVVLIATGTHRGSTEAERRAMLGDDVLARWRVEDHDARDDSGQVDMGMVGDVPVFLDREWVAADLRITTGFVEPHFFAGFSGGPKMVAPGLAGLATTLELHNARRIGDPRATWGVIEGNPVHDAVRAIAAATGVDFALDVLLDDEQRITRAFGGQILAMHAAACEQARHEAMQPVDRPFDIVVTTNSGYPLDQNLYQAVKGMSAAAEVVRPRRHDHLRRGMSRRPPGSRVLRGAPADRSDARGPAGPHRGLPGHGPGSMAGPDPGAGPDQGPGPVALRRPRRRRGPSGPPRTHRRHQ